MAPDVEKVLKKLKNKHTKESIILLDYIEKLNKTTEEMAYYIKNLRKRLKLQAIKEEEIKQHFLRTSRI